MNDARPYASLSSGLLARKGSAKPAMRPQGFTGGFEDLGWNDMGHNRAPDEPDDATPPEHVPSKITALTPAPKKPNPNGFDDYGEEEEGDEAEGYTAQNDFSAPMNFAAETDEDGHEGFTAPTEFAAPMDFAAADYHDEEEEAEAEAGEPHVVAQRRAILESFDGEEEVDAHPAAEAADFRADKADVVRLPNRAAAADGRKAAFTLRLDGGRHLRLRLACAVTGRSAQQIVTGALDSALAAIPEIEALASRVPAKTGSARAKRN